MFSRHIKSLCAFSSVRSCDRRLKILCDSGYLEKKKILYGLPYFYTLSHKAKILIGVNKRIDKIKIDSISHDIHVMDSVLFFIRKFNLCLDDIISEKEMHIMDGFGVRSHKPDFIFIKDNKKYAVEIELSPKSKVRFEKNIKDNYLNYDFQIWIILSFKSKIHNMLVDFQSLYNNINILSLEDIKI